jgi:hypothetical protein
MPRPWNAHTVALCVWLTTSTLASAAAPTVESVVPAVGRIGDEFTVVLSGGHLKDARDLLLYDPGLSCTKLEVVSENEVRLTLLASSDCRPGAHPFRLRTTGGLSELKVVHVTPFPVVREVEPNDNPKGALTVPLNTTVAGVIDSGDVDCVAVALRKGQRLSAEVQAVRLGGELTDTVLTILDHDGRPIAQADDTPITRQDPFASIVVPGDGTYTVQVRDTSFGGGPSSTYALHVGDFPRPAGVYPPGGQAGKEVRLMLLGVQGEPAVQILTLPSAAGPWWDYFPTLGGRTAPTPTAIRVRPYPCVDETQFAAAGSPSAGALTPYDWPVAFHGTIRVPGEADAFAIRARTGEMIQVEAFAVRIGSPMDTILQVYDVRLSAPGASLAQDGAIDLVATVERAPGFDQAIEVSLPYLPPGVEMEGPGIVPPGRSEAVLRLFARPDADPTAWRVAAEAGPAPPRRDRREMTLALMAQRCPWRSAGARRSIPSDSETTSCRSSRKPAATRASATARHRARTGSGSPCSATIPRATTSA